MSPDGHPATIVSELVSIIQFLFYFNSLLFLKYFNCYNCCLDVFSSILFYILHLMYIFINQYIYLFIIWTFQCLFHFIIYVYFQFIYLQFGSFQWNIFSFAFLVFYTFYVSLFIGSFWCCCNIHTIFTILICIFKSIPFKPSSLKPYTCRQRLLDVLQYDCHDAVPSTHENVQLLAKYFHTAPSTFRSNFCVHLDFYGEKSKIWHPDIML